MLTLTEDSRLRCLEQGEGEPLILLPAAGSIGAQWRGVTQALTRPFRCLMPDLTVPDPPSGEAASNRIMLLEDLALVHALVQRCGGRAHLVGHSYGAFLAHRFAAAYPQMVEGLVLIEPIAFDLLEREGPAEEKNEIRALENACLWALAEGEAGKAATLFVNYWSGPGAFGALPEPVRGAMAAVMPKVCWGWREVRLAPPLTQVPGLQGRLVMGEKSPQPTRWIARRLAAQASFPLTELPGAGHMSPMTHPGAVARLLEEHLASVGKGGTACSLRLRCPPLDPHAVSGPSPDTASARV